MTAALGHDPAAVRLLTAAEANAMLILIGKSLEGLFFFSFLQDAVAKVELPRVNSMRVRLPMVRLAHSMIIQGKPKNLSKW